ncbi:PAS domain-containing protein [Desulfopila aestuarii]|uniref:PAS domain S-box-containing protein n=1 Tax=Desulfopila aestuarii DSM 18488 TaxID=1121416 RepID=A0A1M7Y4I3_9BACT|nr:PAS domain-containing protein [Desulfopila aestuarii]SHO47208.1 PAS domain S-box-containing protein [Desulfopila aestuarii DSM 18488]
MILDIKTLLVCDIALSSVFFVAFTVYLLYQDAYPGFKTWTAGILLHTLGLLLLVLRGEIPLGLSVIGFNTIAVFSTTLMLDAVRQFAHNTRLHRLFYLLPAAVAVFCYHYSFIEDNIAIRNMGSSIAIFILMLAISLEWIGHAPSSARPLYYLGAGLILINAVSLMARASHWLFIPAKGIFTADGHDAIHFIIAILSTAGTNIVFSLMNTQQARQSLLTMHQTLADSESRYRKLSEASFEGIVFSQKGKIVEANDNACQMFGCSASELIGTNTHDYIDPKDHDLVTQHISTNIEHAYEVTGVRKDGTSFPLEVQGKTFLFKGAPTRIAALRDITARKRALAILQERDKLYSALFEMNASVMLLIEENTARIIDANSAACDFYGYSKKQFKTLNITDLNILTAEEVRTELERAATRNKKYFSFTHRLANGDIREVEVFTGPIVYQNRSLLCSVVHDITQRKLNEAQREELITSLQQAIQEIKTLRGILPICSHCKQIRDDQGSWSKIEHYVREHSEATFSHGICPDCVKQLYPNIADEILTKSGL